MTKRKPDSKPYSKRRIAPSQRAIACVTSTDEIEDQTRVALSEVVKDFRINWVWMPPWGPDKITDEGREMLRALGFNV